MWVLEDSPLEAEMARRALCVGQDVFVFDDGSVVLERIATGNLPDVLVLDSQLLNISGLEVCRSVRETYGAARLPILMLTVHGGKDDVIEALQAGANDYVTKPYHVAELVARVGNLVAAAQLAANQASRARQLALSADVGAALTAGRGLNETARRAAEVVAGNLRAAAVEVWTRVPGGPLALSAAARDSEDILVPMDLIERAVTESAVAGGDRSLIFFARALVVRGDVIGVIAVATCEPVSDVGSSLVAVANLIALGLARAKAEEERLVSLDRERNARAEAEAANRSKDEFLAMVSHELRTPLNAIAGWTSMLLAGGLDDAKIRRAYETIDRNTRSQAQLIDDLLDIGRITSGQLRLVESTLEVANVAEMAVESIRLTAESRSVRLDATIGSDLGTITGDAARLQQVIWNLLSNAIKFTHKGGIVALAVKRESNSVVITVQDDGQGIAPEFLPRVFDRFKQADNSSTRMRGGLGLGLAIVRHLVELHGGSITATSDGIGKGSLFVVTLPAGVALPKRGSDVLRTSGDRSLDRPREIEGLRALVIDDEPDARELLTILLESCKVHITVASSAADAFALLRKGTFDIILSDIAMPEEDGLSFIRRVRALPREENGRVPAVALTAYARLEDRTRALRAGFNAHVAKPVDPNELFAVMTSLAAAR